jgi:hypothetical protein
MVFDLRAGNCFQIRRTSGKIGPFGSDRLCRINYFCEVFARRCIIPASRPVERISSMKNHHLNFGGIQGSPKFPAFVPCTLVSRHDCGSGAFRSLFLGSGQTLLHSKIPVKSI